MDGSDGYLPKFSCMISYASNPCSSHTVTLFPRCRIVHRCATILFFRHPCSPSPCLTHRNAFQNILSSNWLHAAPAPVRLKLPLPACYVISSDQLALSAYGYSAPIVSAFPHTSIPISIPVTSEAPSPLSWTYEFDFPAASRASQLLHGPCGKLRSARGSVYACTSQNETIGRGRHPRKAVLLSDTFHETRQN